MNRSYKVVDVFTSKPLLGNPVAVILDAEGLDTQAMQAIANWTNLSETTFVVPPSSAAADYGLRIFTPRSELPFAGHPTLGSAHAILESGRAKLRDGRRLIQECKVGLVEVNLQEHDGGRQLQFGLPTATIETLQGSDVEEIEAILRCKVSSKNMPGLVDVGPRWIIAQIADAATVLQLRPDFGRLADFERRLGVTGLTVFGPREGDEYGIEVRTFAPSCGVEEDPVCGSGNGSVAVFHWHRGLLASDGQGYLAMQGRCVGRDGRVHVNVDAEGRVRIGGSCVTCVDGSLSL